MAKEKDILQDSYSSIWTPVTTKATGKITNIKATGYLGRGVVKSLMEGVLDTKDYSPVSLNAKYKSENKASQALSNALKAGKKFKGKKTSRGAGYEFLHSTVIKI
jgi:hypothetical protein